MKTLIALVTIFNNWYQFLPIGWSIKSNREDCPGKWSGSVRTLFFDVVEQTLTQPMRISLDAVVKMLSWTQLYSVTKMGIEGTAIEKQGV